MGSLIVSDWVKTQALALLDHMMNPASQLRAPMAVTLIIALTALNTGRVASSELVDLETFIGGIELGCRPPQILEKFRSDLNKRYNYEEAANRLRHTVLIPENVKTAVGRADAINHGEYTEIIVPLTGSYRGLPTRSLSFSIGHSNGINVTRLTFGASRSELERVMGSEVMKTQQAFESDPEERVFGFSARITDQPEGSALVCNTST